MRQARAQGRSFAYAWLAIGGACALNLAAQPAIAAPPPALNPPSSRSEKAGEATLLTDADPLTSAVAVTAFLRAPLAPPAPPGLRYLLERLILDPSHPAGARAMALRARGWRVQAFTTPDYTAYQVVADRQSLDEALRLVRAVLSEPPLPSGSAAELLLTQHRQGIALLPSSSAGPATPLSRLFGLAYGDHPGARSVVGTAEGLASYHAAALREHWAQFYRPAALTLVLSGAIDAAMIAAARQQLGELETHIARSRGRPSPASSAALLSARTTSKTGAGQHHLGPQVRLLPESELAAGQPGLWLGFALDGASPTELTALELAAQLPQPAGREASLVLGPAQSPALFVLRAPAPTSDPSEGLRTVVEAALHLADAASDDAVARARRRLLLDVARRAETPAGRALRLVGLSLSGGDEAAWQRRISELMASDVKRALGRFLQLERLSVLLRAPSRPGHEPLAHSERRLRERLLTLSARSMPSPALPVRPLAATGKSSDASARAQVLRSESGAHVVLLPEPGPGPSTARRGLVAFTALWPGGRKREDARLRGLHDLLVRVWPHATASLPSFALASLLGDLNLSLQAEASDDALALRGQLPSEGLPQALALLHECLESPRISESEVERARRDVVLAYRRSALGSEPPGARGPRPLRGASSPDIDAARYAEQLFAQALSASTSATDGGKLTRGPRYEDLATSVTVLTPRHVQDLVRSYERAPLLLALVGDFEPSSVIAQLAPWLGTLKPLAELPRTLLPVADQVVGMGAGLPAGRDATPSSAQPPATATQLFAQAATGQAHLVLGARVPGCAAAERSTPLALQLLLELLASEAGTGEAQTLLLSRRALAFSVEGSLSACLPERALSIYVATSPRNLEAAEAGLRDELRRLSDHPIAAEALSLARERLISRWVLLGQRRSDRALQLARALLFGLPDPALSGDHPAELLRRITAAELQALAKHYLRDELLLRVAVLPESQRLAVGARGVSLRPVPPAPAVEASALKPAQKPRGRAESATLPRGGNTKSSPATERPTAKSAKQPAGIVTSTPAQKAAAQAGKSPPRRRAASDDSPGRAQPGRKQAGKLPQRL